MGLDLKWRFTVKSAYNVAQKVLKVEGHRGKEGGSSDSTGMRDIWRIVWRLNCPNKIKHLFWRACKNILPTKLFLKARGIGKDGACDMCGLGESSGHALWSCRIAEAVWCSTRLKLPYFHDPPSDFIDIAWEIKNRWVGVNWNLFATTVWGLWNNENQVRRGGQCKSYEMIVKEVIEYLKEYQAANMCAEHHYT